MRISEAAVQHALERAMRRSATLVIAHRLAAVQKADRNIVVGAGRAVAQGSRAKLMRQGGRYSDSHDFSSRLSWRVLHLHAVA